jgi:hypothetical protein
MLSRFKHNKRGQSESVGFVLIVVIVTIIILVFLYFMFRTKNDGTTTSTDMSNLLNAFSEYTTNCTTTFIPQYKTGSELISECYGNSGEMCMNGKNVCEELNDTIKEVIGKTLDVGPDFQNKAYRITINYYAKGTENNKTWFKTGEGSFTNCTERYGGYNTVSANPGSLEVRLEVCKARNNEN